MLPLGSFIYPSEWIMGMGYKAAPKETICSSALIGWALGSENIPTNEARRLSSQSLLRFVHFSGRRVRQCLDPKRFPNGTCKLDFKHLPRGILWVQSYYFKQKHCLARNYFGTELIPTFTVATKRILFWPANTSKKTFLAIHGKGVSAPWWKCGKRFHMFFLAGKKVQMSSQ